MTAATGRLVWHNTIVNSSNVHDLHVIMIDDRNISLVSVLSFPEAVEV